MMTCGVAQIQNAYNLLTQTGVIYETDPFTGSYQCQQISVLNLNTKSPVLLIYIELHPRIQVPKVEKMKVSMQIFQHLRGNPIKLKKLFI